MGTGISIRKPELIAAHDFEGIAELIRLHTERMNQANAVIPTPFKGIVL